MCGICDIVVLLKFDVINNYRNNSEIIFSVEWYICNHKNNVLITINNWNDINLVEKYVGSKVYADAADEPPLLEEEYEADALIGLEVLDENNNNIGVVKDFIEVPQGYIMEIDDGKQGILIPFVDEFIIDVNDENIVVKVLEKCQ